MRMAGRSTTNLGTGGVGDLGINPVNNYNLFQADLSFRF